MTGQCLNIHSTNGSYRQGTGGSLLPGSDIATLWLQLQEKTFSFKGLYTLHGSDWTVSGTDWVLSEPSSWPKLTISQMQPEKPGYYLLSRTPIPIPILYSYTQCIFCERNLSCRRSIYIYIYLDNIYMHIYTHMPIHTYIHICMWMDKLFSGHWEREGKTETRWLP